MANVLLCVQGEFSNRLTAFLENRDHIVVRFMNFPAFTEQLPNFNRRPTTGALRFPGTAREGIPPLQTSSFRDIQVAVIDIRFDQVAADTSVSLAVLNTLQRVHRNVRTCFIADTMPEWDRSVPDLLVPHDILETDPEAFDREIRRGLLSPDEILLRSEGSRSIIVPRPLIDNSFQSPRNHEVR